MRNFPNYEDIDRARYEVSEFIIDTVKEYRDRLVSEGYDGEGLSELDEHIEGLGNCNAIDEVLKGDSELQDHLVNQHYSLKYLGWQVEEECQNWVENIIERVDGDVGFDMDDDANSGLFDRD